MTEPPAWDAYRDLWQEVLNALPIPPRRAQVSAPVPIPVTARLVWERDGVEERETDVLAWTSRSVLVGLQDRRRQTIGVWLRPEDVRRRGRAPVERSTPDQEGHERTGRG